MWLFHIFCNCSAFTAFRILLMFLLNLTGVFQILKVKSRTEGEGEGLATVSNAGRLEAGENLNRPDVPRTLRDDLLLKQCEEIKVKYLAPFYAKLAAVQADFQGASKQACFFRSRKS